MIMNDYEIVFGDLDWFVVFSSGIFCFFFILTGSANSYPCIKPLMTAFPIPSAMQTV